MEDNSFGRRCIECWELKEWADFQNYGGKFGKVCKDCLEKKVAARPNLRSHLSKKQYRKRAKRFETEGLCVADGCQEKARVGKRCLRHNILNLTTCRLSRKYGKIRKLITLGEIDEILAASDTDLKTGDCRCMTTGEKVNWYLETAFWVVNYGDNLTYHVESLQHYLSNGENKVVSVKQSWKNRGKTAMRGLKNKTGGSALGVKMMRIHESRNDWVCPYLGYPLNDIGDLSIDHVIPVKNGGKSELSNLQFVSRAANKIKGDHSHEWMCQRFGLKVEPAYLG